MPDNKVTILALMNGVQAQEILVHLQGRARAFVGPGHRGAVVASNSDRAFANVAMLGHQHILVSEDGGQFQVRNRQCAGDIA